MSDSSVAKNPTGGACARHGLTQPALRVDWMQAVVAPENMRAAWARVKSNKGAPGSDGMPIEDFPAFARTHWPTIRQALLDGRYCPQPVRRVVIPKPGGGERALGIPSVVDRLIQQAIAQVMTPIFDPQFSESSFGFRPKRSAHGALKQVQAHIKAGYRIAVDLDLKKFFDNVQHDILMARVARKVGDKRLLALIGRYLRAGVRIGECVEPSEVGTPQGGPLSPLLANILLDDLDRELEKRGHRFARYADDLIVLVKSIRTGMGYFGISEYYRPVPELDEWLRRRVRMCYWKQWRHTRTKVRNLLALGTGRRAAILTAISSKGYWHLSRSLATQTGMTNDWLRTQGLVSIRALWMKAHGYA